LRKQPSAMPCPSFVGQLPVTTKTGLPFQEGHDLKRDQTFIPDDHDPQGTMAADLMDHDDGLPHDHVASSAKPGVSSGGGARWMRKRAPPAGDVASASNRP
jgi:hypothetical protein